MLVICSGQNFETKQNYNKKKNNFTFLQQFTENEDPVLPETIFL